MVFVHWGSIVRVILDQGLATNSPQAKSCMLPVFVEPQSLEYFLHFNGR